MTLFKASVQQRLRMQIVRAVVWDYRRSVRPRRTIQEVREAEAQASAAAAGPAAQAQVHVRFDAAGPCMTAGVRY